MTRVIVHGAFVTRCTLRPSHATFDDPRIPPHIWLRVVPEPNSGCWLWTWYTVNGYGRLTVKRRTWPAHRFFYTNLVAPVPPELQMDHLCRTECCVNPDHLEPVTPRENTLRSKGPAALAARQTQCKYGHVYTAESVRINSEGHRYCRICERVRHRYRLVDGRLKRVPAAELEADLRMGVM